MGEDFHYRLVFSRFKWCFKGQLLGWNNSHFEKLHVLIRAFFLTGRFKDQSCPSFCISSIYGPYADSRQQGLRQEFSDVVGWVDGSWLIGADFNITQFHRGRNSAEIHIRCKVALNDTIHHLFSLRPSISSRKFTWTNNRTTPSSTTLGKFLLSFLLFTIKAFPEPLLDHTSILLVTNTTSHHGSTFRIKICGCSTMTLIVTLATSGLHRLPLAGMWGSVSRPSLKHYIIS